MKQFLTIVVIVLLSVPLNVAAQDRFVAKLTLPTGQTVVVAEGDFEARSTGSFSVRLYEAASTPNEITFYTSGLIRFRDGVLEKVMLADVDGDCQPEIIVIARSVGTGDYLSAHALAFTKDRLFFCAAVEGLPPDTDPIAALQKSKTENKWHCER